MDIKILSGGKDNSRDLIAPLLKTPPPGDL